MRFYSRGEVHVHRAITRAGKRHDSLDSLATVQLLATTTNASTSLNEEKILVEDSC